MNNNDFNNSSRNQGQPSNQSYQQQQLQQQQKQQQNGNLNNNTSNNNTSAPIRSRLPNVNSNKLSIENLNKNSTSSTTLRDNNLFSALSKSLRVLEIYRQTLLDKERPPSDIFQKDDAEVHSWRNTYKEKSNKAQVLLNTALENVKKDINAYIEALVIEKIDEKGLMKKDPNAIIAAVGVVGGGVEDSKQLNELKQQVESLQNESDLVKETKLTETEFKDNELNLMKEEFQKELSLMKELFPNQMKELTTTESLESRIKLLESNQPTNLSGSFPPTPTADSLPLPVESSTVTSAATALLSPPPSFTLPEYLTEIQLDGRFKSVLDQQTSLTNGIETLAQTLGIEVHLSKKRKVDALEEEVEGGGGEEVEMEGRKELDGLVQKVRKVEEEIQDLSKTNLSRQEEYKKEVKTLLDSYNQGSGKSLELLEAKLVAIEQKGGSNNNKTNEDDDVEMEEIEKQSIAEIIPRLEALETSLNDLETTIVTMESNFYAETNDLHPTQLKASIDSITQSLDSIITSVEESKSTTLILTSSLTPEGNDKIEKEVEKDNNKILEKLFKEFVGKVKKLEHQLSTLNTSVVGSKDVVGKEVEGEEGVTREEFTLQTAAIKKLRESCKNSLKDLTLNMSFFTSIVPETQTINSEFRLLQANGSIPTIAVRTPSIGPSTTSPTKKDSTSTTTTTAAASSSKKNGQNVSSDTPTTADNKKSA